MKNKKMLATIIGSMVILTGCTAEISENRERIVKIEGEELQEAKSSSMANSIYYYEYVGSNGRKVKTNKKVEEYTYDANEKERNKVISFIESDKMSLVTEEDVKKNSWQDSILITGEKENRKYYPGTELYEYSNSASIELNDGIDYVTNDWSYAEELWDTNELLQKMKETKDSITKDKKEANK